MHHTQKLASVELTLLTLIILGCLSILLVIEIDYIKLSLVYCLFPFSTYSKNREVEGDYCLSMPIYQINKLSNTI